MDEEHKKITEVEDLPKNHGEYIKRLLKKKPWFMNLEELKDYLDYVLTQEIKNRDENCIKYLLNQLLICTRIIDLQTNLIIGRADANNHFVKAILLFLKEKYPEDYEKILSMADNFTKEHDMETVKDLPIITQERILEKANKWYKQELEEEDGA